MFDKPKVTLGVDFNINQQQLTKLQAEFTKLQKLTSADLMKINPDFNADRAKQQLIAIKKEAGEVQTAITSAFNPKIGSLNVSKLQDAFKNLDIGQIYQDFKAAGDIGIKTFNNIPSAVMRTNLQLKESHSLLDRIGDTMTNSLKWGLTSRVVNSLADSLQGAWNYTKALDTSLNDIRIVTNKSADEMERFAVQANRAAQNLGSSTKDYTDAALIYYQQGLDDTESQKRAEITLKTANVTGQSGREVSEQLTAIWNGYKVTADEAELYIDKVAKVAAGTAADLEEMATGMSKVAAAASNAGVDIDQLNATLATVVSVTREAPETIGSSFKTIYARLGDLKLGGTDEDGVSLGNVSSQLEDLGIQILTDNGDLRDMGDIVEDIGNKWQDWSRAQQQAAAIAMAGKMQYSRLIALFDNWDDYNKALEMSVNSMGTLQEQQNIYMESTQAHLNKLSTAWERVFDSFVDNKGINKGIDALTLLTNGLANFIEAIGGGGNVLLTFGSIATNVFSKQIAASIDTTIKNVQAAKYNLQQINGVLETLNKQQESYKKGHKGEENQALTARIQGVEKLKNRFNLMSNEQLEKGLAITEAKGTAQNNLDAFDIGRDQAIARLQQFMAQQNQVISTEEAEQIMLDTSSAAWEKYDQAIDNNSQTLQEYKTDINQLKIAQDEYKKSLEDVAQAEQQYGKRSKEATSARKTRNEKGKNLTNTYQKVKGDLTNLSERQDLSGTTINGLVETINNAEDQIKTSTVSGLTDLANDIQNFADSATQAVTSVQNDFNNLGDTIEQVGSDITDGVRDQLVGALNAATEDEDTFFEDIDTTASIQSIVQLTAAVGQTISGFTSLINIIDILNNEDLSGGEKALQIIMALGMGLPMVINGLMTMSTATKSLAVATGVLETAEGAAFKTALVGILSIETALGPVWLIIVAITAALALIVGTCVAISNANNATAEAAKEASEYAKQMKAQLEEANAAAEELKSTIESFEDAVSAIDDLTTGTEEYNQAIQDANKKAKELIETLGLLSDQYYYNGKGIIQFKEGVLEDKQKEANQKVINAQAMSYVAETESNKANIVYQSDKFAEKVGSVSSKDGIYVEGSYWSDNGWGQRELNPETIANIVEGLSDSDAIIKKFGKDLDLLTNEELKQAILGIDNISPAAQQMIDSIIREKDSLLELVDSTKKASDANYAYAKELTKLAIQEKYGDRITKFNTDSNGIVDTTKVDLMESILTNASIENTNKVKDQLGNYNIGEIKSNSDLEKFLKNNFGKELDWSGDDDKVIALEYAKTVKKATGNLTYDADDGGFGHGTVTDTQGNKIIDQMDDIAMRKGIAEYYAKEKIMADLKVDINQDELESSLENMTLQATKVGEEYGTDFSTSMLAAIANGTGELDFSGLFSAIDPNEHDDLIKLSGEQLMEKFGINQALLEQGGWDSAETFKNSFQKAFDEWDWNINDAIDSAISSKNSELEKISDGDTKKKLEEASEDVKVYAKNLMQIAKSGKEVAKELEFDADTATDFAFRIIKMNKAIDTLADNFDDWKDVIKKSSKTSQEYAKAMYGMRDALADVYDTSLDYIGNDFVEGHLDQIKKIATGDEEAINGLRKELSEEIVANILVENRLGEQKDAILDDFSTLYDMIQDQMKDIKVGAAIDDTALVQGLNDMIEQCGLTVQQANAIFSEMGIEPTYETETIQQEQSNPIIQTDTQTVETEGTKLKYTNSEGKEVEEVVPNFRQIQKSKTIGYETSKVDVPVTALAMNGKQPTISGIKKAPTASMNNYSSVNKGGGSPGKSSKSGGSSSKPSKEKKLDKQKDPYHDVNIQLELTNSKLKMVQSQNDKAFGAKKIENYNKQLQLLNNKLDTTKEKLKIAESEQNRLGQLLAARGAKFNSDGTIANYAQLYEQQLAKVNAMIEKYNGMSKDEQEAYKETLDEAKDDFSKFEEQLKDYDDTVSNLIPELKQDLQDAIDEEIEINIKKFNMEFEIRLDMADAQKDWNEFKKKILDDIDDDDILGNAKARARDDLSVYLDENGKGMLAAGTKQTNEILNELAKMDSPSGWSDVYGDDRTSAFEDLQEAYQNIEESLLEIDAIQEDVFQAWLDTMDDISDKMQTQLDYYDQISSIIEHDQEVIKLVYGETDFEALGKMYELQHKNNLDLLDFRKQQVAFWENEMNAIEDKDSEAWQKARDNWMSAVSDLNSSIEDSINLIREKMENTIDGIFDKLNKDITNGKGLDYLEQQWDLINDVSEDYLDNVNAAFGLRDLERKYQNAIDNTDNVSAQRKLNALMEKELGELRDKDKLTEYDLERAQKRYELELKRMALEEAQNTKTKMRLRRDSQGNYRYEYVADEDNIAKLREEVDQLENSLYNFDKERFISLQNDIVGYIRDREDAIKEIQMDATLTEEERQNRILEITDLYNQKIQDITDQTVTAQNNLYQSGADELNKIWTQEGQDFQALSNEEQRIMVEEMVPQFTSGVHDMVEAFSGEGGFEARTKESMAALSQATLDYQTDLEAIQIASGETFDEVEQGLDKNIPKTEQLVDDTDKLYDSYQDELQAIKDVNAQLDKQIQKYQQIAEAAKSAATEAYNYWKQQQEMAANASAKDKVENQNTSDKGTNNTTNSASGGGSSAGGPGHGGGDYTVISGDTLSGLALRFGGNADKWTDIYNKNKSIIDSVAKSKGYSTGGHWIFPGTKLYIPFRSGGYTGDWEDDNGRLAVLHKKELVLNANDTANMLDMMKIARDVIASAGPNLKNISAGTYNGSGDGSLEQNVHIEANFPNVESANEIEEAINNLVNLAAQRANRKIR